jgi:hypothetical protein
MFSSDYRNAEVAEEINSLLKRYPTGVLMFVDAAGKCYLLKEHWKFIRPEDDAKRLHIGNVVNTPPGPYYFYEEVTSLDKFKPRTSPKEKFVATKLIVIKKKAAKKR